MYETQTAIPHRTLSVVRPLLHPTRPRRQPRDHPPSGDQTGQTDADALQAALTAAVPGTVIQLATGTYYLNHVLLSENFQDTIQGRGQQAS